MSNSFRPFLIGIFLFFSFELKSQHADSSAIENMTPEKWKEDLHFMTSEMKKVHKNIFHTMSKTEFENSVKEVEKKISSLTNNQILVEFLKLIKNVEDGHSYMFPDKMHIFPIRIYDFKDGVYVTHAENKYKNLVGMKLVKIQNKNLSEIYDLFDKIIPRDNDMWVKYLIPQQIIIDEYLNGLVMSPSNLFKN